MYLGSWKIDDYLTFACNTHRFDTGVATDADAAPSYRIYEDETATPILTGNLALLDSANTAGFYSERVQLTVANGLEKGKTYTIYISMTVNSVESTISHSFQIDALIDDVWDEILSGTTHNIAGSAGRRVREIGAFAIHSGTAQAGASNSITLAATANGGDGVYNRNLIVLTDNTGVGQTRTIVDYDDTTKAVVIDRDWRITPDNTTAYQIVPDNTPLVVDHGVAQAGSTSTTIKLRAYASDINDNYLCNIVVIVAGTGRGQARLVGSYDGSTKVVTICGDNWVTTPDVTSVYVMMPYGTTCTSCIGTDALALINAEVADVLTVDTIADSYVTDGNQPTIAQAILAIQQMMQEKSITGTTLTVKKPDGSTSAMTFTLDSETAPTSITRAT